jgi:glucuronosyltransferase
MFCVLYKRGESSMWLIRTDFAFEYPRPMMPNVQFIGGFHCKNATPIDDQALADWADGATNGLVIFSMGSMVSEMHKLKRAWENKINSKFERLF